jgi:hypothetical protein
MSIRALLEDIGVVLDETDPVIAEATAPGKKKQMVIMVGGPASGKGFFLGSGGKGLPKSTKNLFKQDDIPDAKVGFAESDNNLRGIQYFESKKHYKALKEAEKKGPEAFKKALDDNWYKTKDGKKVKMENFGKMPPVPEPHDKFYDASLKFYRQMRGWHNDADETNPETGKPKERFKDQARKSFEDYTAKKIMEEDKDFMIIDSAGEDIDAQDFEGQIARGKAAGFEVSVIFLDIEKEDTKLSNMARGFVAGKRMVDEQDIDNFFNKYDAAIEKIKKAAPNRFLHFKRKPPLTKEERAKLSGLMTHSPDGTPTFLTDPASAIKTINDLPADQQKSVKGGVMKMLYKPQYTLDTESSFSDSGKDLPAYKAPRPSEAQSAMDSGSTGAAVAKAKKALAKGKAAQADLDNVKGMMGGGDKDYLKKMKAAGEKGGGAASAAKPEDPKARKAAQVDDAKKLKPDAYKKKWGRCPNGWRHQGGGHCIPRAQYMKMSEAEELLETVESASGHVRFISKASIRMAKALDSVMKPIKDHDYKASVETAGLSFLVKLKGGSGDITALRKIRRSLQRAADSAVKSASGGTVTKTKLIPSNLKGDMVILVEPQYP